MVIGESSVEDDEDCKPPSRPQHHCTAIDGMDEAETESGIVMTTLASSSSSGILKRCDSSCASCGDLHDMKRLKLDVDHGVASQYSTMSGRYHSLSQNSSEVVKTSTGDRRMVGLSPPQQDSATSVSSITGKVSSADKIPSSHVEISQISDSNSSLSVTQLPAHEEIPEPTIPLKSTHFRHLQQKYLGELEYMLREFQKLERQLLGAKTAVGAAASESVASRERREKLHSFIQHLEDTIQQISAGVEVEAAGQSACSTLKPVRDSALSKNVSREKEEEEAVQKIEEHILANLLPVKVRLKKQLAAQQGAKHNPAGMPPARGGLMLQADTSQQGKATFLTKVEERRASLLGTTALHGGGSNLTQKLHGPPMGSLQPMEPEVLDKTDVRDTALPLAKRSSSKILYAGLALGSSQILSSVQAATAVHKIEMQDPALIEVRSKLYLALAEECAANSPISSDFADLKLSTLTESDLPLPESGDEETALSDDYDYDEPDHIYSKHGTQLSLAAHAAIISYEEKRKARKKRRKKKKLLLLKQQEQQQQQQQLPVAVTSTTVVPKRKKIVKKRGPHNVEYMCALCNEVYNSTCEYNPWWALTQHECPKCNKMQIPKIDIGAPANAIEYHPALLAHADENGGVSVHTPEAVILPPPPEPKDTPVSTSDAEDVLESDLSDDDGLLSDDDSFYCSDSDGEAFPMLSSADRAENEKFGFEYDGPRLSDLEASRLLVLMLHATTCPCQHLDTHHLEVCRSTKYMMLHVRDCPGTTASFDVCPFPWCRKVKHLLYHLVSCSEPAVCAICSNIHLNRNMRHLKGLNYHRGENFHTTLLAKNRAKAEALQDAATTDQIVDSQVSEEVVYDNSGNAGENPLSVETGAGTAIPVRTEPQSSLYDTEPPPVSASATNAMDCSIVSPSEDPMDTTKSLDSCLETVHNPVLAAIHVEDDCMTGRLDSHTICTADMELPTSVLPHDDRTNAVDGTVSDEALEVPPSTSDPSVDASKDIESSSNTLDHSEHPLDAADFNSVTPVCTKG